MKTCFKICSNSIFRKSKISVSIKIDLFWRIQKFWIAPSKRARRDDSNGQIISSNGQYIDHLVMKTSSSSIIDNRSWSSIIIIDHRSWSSIMFIDHRSSIIDHYHRSWIMDYRSSIIDHDHWTAIIDHRSSIIDHDTWRSYLLMVLSIKWRD